MVMVYHFKGWSQTEGDNLIPPRKATEEFMKAHKVTKIEGTGEDVPAERVDGNGLYDSNA
jgi:hypothetical protein